VLRRLRWLVWKDLLESVRSQTAWLVLLSPLLLAWVMQTMTEQRDLRKIPLALVCSPDSAVARVLEDDSRVELLRATDLASAQAWLEGRKAVICIELSEGFDQHLRAGNRPRLRIWQDRSHPTQVALGREYLRGALRKMLGSDALPVDFEVVEGGRGRPQDFWFAAAAVMASMSAMVVAASSLVEEKEAGTLQQMLLSPASPTELWIGKLAVSGALGTAAAMSVVALRGPSWSSFGGALVLTAVASFVFAALGGVLGLLAKGPAAASSWTGIVFIACFVPATMSETSQALSRWAYASPAYYLHDGLQRAVLAQESVITLIANFGVLTALGAVLTLIGARLLRRYR